MRLVFSFAAISTCVILATAPVTRATFYIDPGSLSPETASADGFAGTNFPPNTYPPDSYLGDGQVLAGGGRTNTYVWAYNNQSYQYTETLKALGTVSGTGNVSAVSGVVDVTAISGSRPNSTEAGDTTHASDPYPGISASSGLGSLQSVNLSAAITSVGLNSGYAGWRVSGGSSMGGLSGGGTGKRALRNIGGYFDIYAQAHADYSSELPRTSSRVVIHYSARESLVSPADHGDVNQDGTRDQLDATLVGFSIGDTYDAALDLNSDSSITSADVDDLLATFGTVRGDANFDHTVTFTDLTILAQNYNKAGTWYEADFNGDGLVDFSDYTTLAQNYGYGTGGRTVSASFAADWALLQATAPEPGTLLTLAMATVYSSARRRR